MTSATRSGAGSPSHDPLAPPGSGRFLSSKRCVYLMAEVLSAIPMVSRRNGAESTEKWIC